MRVPVVLVAAALGVTVLVACDDQPEAAEEDTPGTEVFDLEPGNCLLHPGFGQVREVERVDCDGPHDLEVFHTFELPGEVLPTRALMRLATEAGCSGEPFTRYVGIEFHESELSLQPIVPTQATWDEGDRQVICTVYDPEAGTLVGTVRGSER